MRHLRQSRVGIWVPLVAGLFWLVDGASSGFFGFVFSVVPGSLLVASGVAALRMPGDPRKFQLGALGGVVGAVLALPMLFAAGFFEALWLFALSSASFLAAGWSSQQREPDWEEVPTAVPSLPLAAKSALDEAVLATMSVARNGLLDLDLARVADEVQTAVAVEEARGFAEKPETFHPEPPPLESLRVVRGRAAGMDFEHVTFESAYEPDPEMPGRDRWLGRRANRTAHAWMLRHTDERPRPWLVCIHGYGMGLPWADLWAFEAARLHQDLGLNLLFPVLPLHGPRRAGLRSNEAMLGGDVIDALHGEAQAVSDIRRLLGWARAEDAVSIGVYGLSLGAYTAALLGSLEEDLACVIAGIPPTDFPRLIFRLSPSLSLRELARLGVSPETVASALSVVSPLALESRVAHDRRFIFGGTADRIVTPDQVRDLWRHWDKPEIAWYSGSHFSFRRDPEVRRLVDRALREWRLG